MTSEPKKFDAVTIIGLALAVAIMFFGMRYTNTGKGPAPGAVGQGTGTVVRATVVAPGPEKSPPEPAKEIVETPDIVVSGTYLDLSFASRGASIRSARLPGPDVDQDAAKKKNKKGLDLLAEIEPGKRTFGIARFAIGPADKQVAYEGAAAPDQRVWALKSDSGAFNAAGIRTIEFVLPIDSYVLTKTYTIDNNPLVANPTLGGVVKCDLKIENKSENDVECAYWIYGPQGILLDIPVPEPPGSTTHGLIQAEIAGRDSTDGSGTEPDVLQLYADAAKTAGEVSKKENLWGAVKNRFFMASLVSLQPQQLVRISVHGIQQARHPDPRYAEPNIGVLGARYTVKINKNTVQEDSYALYVGPADDRHIDAAEAKIKPPSQYHMRMAIQFCDIFWRWPRVDWLARQMMWLFNALHKLFGSFGIAVALMTIIIKLCLHPLQRKMMVSMSKMAKMQPELAKIKERYKNATGNEAKMKMTLEQQDLMRKSGVNPAGGCLPMFLQIPIFSALYGIFNHAFDMRGAEFLWIKDLSQPDRLATLTFWPYSVNLLPILYAAISFLQTRMMPQQKSDDPQQEMNRKMMMYMPVMISLMFYSMPAGLVLYFAVSACWGMLESWYIKKFIIKDPPSPTGPTAPIIGTAKPVAAMAK